MNAAEAQGHLADGFRRAREAPAAQLVVQDYVIAGAPTRLRVVGAELARSLDAVFSHLRSEPEREEPPAVHADVWDAGATGIPSPRAGRRAGHGWVHGDSARPCDGGMLTTAAADRHLTFERGEALAWLDRRGPHVVACYAHAAGLPLCERAKPFTPLLSIWLRDRGVHAVHAALVASKGKGMLVAGGGGVGKTTCALLCVEAGFAYLGDDLVAVEQAPGGGFTGHSVYGSSRIAPEDFERFGRLAGHALPGRPPAEPKALVLLSRVPGIRLLRSVPLRAIVLPRLATASRTCSSPLGKAEAFRMLVQSSLLAWVPSPGRAGAEALATLVDRIPAYRLDLGRDLTEIAGRVQEILDRVAA